MKAQFFTFANRLMMMALVVFFSAVACFAQAQASTADLIGTVVDPNGAVVAGATVTARNPATGISRTVTANDSGEYQIIGLQPGNYEVTAQAATFRTVVVSPVRLTVGQRAELRIQLEVGEATAVVNVTGDAVQLIETTQPTISNTIDQQRIENLPINERSATGFALTISTVGRDNGRPIGPAPTSGLNIGGQRGRSTQVNVDGSDFTDNSINAARSTVSQEAVQEYQVATNSYTAEFGRATGGIINVVTKRGTNDFTGNLFGFIRDKRFQARNPFAPIDRPDFRRTQFGGTLGGPMVRDQLYFFASYEGRRRDESGFFTSDVRKDMTASVTIPVIPGFNPVARTFSNLTPAQAAFVNSFVTQGSQLLAAGQVATAAQLLCAARAYAFFASSGGSIGLTGTNPLTSPNDGSACPAISPILPGTVGSRFLLTGTPVPISPIAFRPLNDLQRIFPVTERAHYSSLRIDHNINPDNQFTMRFGYNPITMTGIQVESQNQSLGQNDFSRTGITDIKDYSVSAGLNSTITSTTANEFRFSFGRRQTSFRSQSGEAVAYNISGATFIGRELFSPVDRAETRFQLADNFNWVVGSHTFKFGGDINFVSIPRALFELNFAGLFNFSDFNAANLGFPANAPAFTPVQSYGLGLPQNYIQGFGDPISAINNKPIAFFAQDTWRATRRLTLNYGIRYDVELTEQIAPVGLRDPLSGISLSSADILAAQDALGVQQGIPRDYNNWAPRFGFAWDMFGNGRTVIRGAVGLFYDHPLLAVAFNSDIADATQQQQAVLTAGSPALTTTTNFTIITGGVPTTQTFNSNVLLNAAQVFQGTVCTPASANPVCPPGFNTPGAAPTAQYQFGRQRFNDQTFTGLGAVLPFSLPVAKDFQYASAVQANLTFERQLTRNMAFTASYIMVNASHLPHPTDLNTPRQDLQIQNFQRFAGRLPNTGQEAVAGIAIPSGTSTGGVTVGPGTLFTNPYGVTCAVVIPGMIAQCPTGRVITPAIANFFRPNSPNYFLASALSGGAVTKAILDSQLTGSLRTPGLISPFGAVNAQVSDGKSSYNALNLEVKRRFANNFTFLASHTWSHTIDDSSDLQTLLIAQNPRNHRLERANSLFDQRHRFVFSGVLASPVAWRNADSGWKRFLSDFTIAPILEISSGRPFNIITNVDANNDQSSSTDRPRVLPDGTLCVPGEPLPGGGTCGTIFENDPTLGGALSLATGSLGRNMGITRGYASFDLRIARSIRFGERARLELIAEGFNLFNRFNEASASPNYRDVNAFGQRDNKGRYYSLPTAAYDPRQFQFGAKLHF
jgi:hypothetical protein